MSLPLQGSGKRDQWVKVAVSRDGSEKDLQELKLPPDERDTPELL
jgi:hypothetical protein